MKLSYNELGYNEHSVMTNNFFCPKWIFYYINQPGYNEIRLYQTNSAGPKLLVITEFGCIVKSLISSKNYIMDSKIKKEKFKEAQILENFSSS